MLAKFWLQPAALAQRSGFAATELRRLLTLVEANHVLFMEAWDEFFAA